MTKRERSIRWLEMYKSGITDSEIAEIDNIKKHTVSCWRDRNNLPPNPPQKAHRVYPDDTKRLWDGLRQRGLSNREIAKIEKCETRVITNWSHRNKIRPCNNYGNNGEKWPEIHERRMHLYNLGLTDTEIAKSEKCTISAITIWRNKNNLPRNKKQK